MSFDKKILSDAVENIRKNGRRSKLLWDSKLNKAKISEPRISEVENEIMYLGPKLGMAAISGKSEDISSLKEKSFILNNEKIELYKKYGIEYYTPNCGICGDTGYLKNGTICSCVINEAKKLSIAELSREMPIDDCSFDNFNLNYYNRSEDKKCYEIMSKNLSFCKKYVSEFSINAKNILFMGGTGLGKTHLSLAIARALIKKGFGVFYSPAQDLIQRLENEHFSYSNETPILERVLNADFLIIDDLGTEFSTSFSKSLIYNIINTRLLKRYPTLLNTNLSLNELEDQYTPRVTSRILGNYNIRKFSGNDIRQLKRLDEIEAK